MTAARAWVLSSAFQISASAFFAPGCADLGSAARTFAILWNQQRCLAGLGEHLAQRASRTPAPRRRRPGPGRACRAVSRHAAGRPSVSAGLAVAVGQRDQLLGAVGAHPDQHQQAQLVLAEADVDVDAVGPAVHVVHTGQVPLGERLLLVLPLLTQPGHRRGGQPGARAEELLQRGHEVSTGQPAQIQQRQHLADLRGCGGTTPAGSPKRTACRSPVASSTRLSSTRGARTATAPAVHITVRASACPLRTTSRCPSSSSSPSELRRDTRRPPRAARPPASAAHPPARSHPAATTTAPTRPTALPSCDCTTLSMGVPSRPTFQRRPA